MIRRTSTWLAVVGIVVVAFWALDPYYRDLITAPWRPSFFEVLPETLVGALRVWAFWGAATAVGAGLLVRYTAVGGFDALLLGALAPWVASLFLGTLLGPFGLLGTWTVRLPILVGAAVLLVRRPPRAAPEWTVGLRLVGVAALMVLPPLFLEQLGSPVPPHFDVFAPLAAAQRIVTFGYLPFDNDPYGYYGRAAGMPAVELFYAVLTLGSGVSTASLAGSAAIVPMAVLLLLVTYRLGVTMAGDRCGGFAALLLLDTMIFRVLPYAHGRYVAFVPAIAGLAYVIDRDPIRRIAGGLLLATSIACHAIIGSFAMASAVVGGLPFLFGASVLAFPTILVAVGPTVHPLVLSALHGAGAFLLAAAAYGWNPPSSLVMTRLASLLGRAVLLGLVWLIVTHPTITLVNGFVECWRFPVVLPLAALGAFIQTLTLTPARRILLTTPCLVGIAAAIAGAKVEIPGLPWAAHDFTAKAEFWIPVSLCFPAAAGLAWLSRWSLRILTLVLVAFLVIPWAPRAAAKLNYGECAKTTIRDPNYNSIAWAEAIGQYLAIAKVGYWNPRWAQYPAERALYDLLRLEVEAGRVTADTHIVHVAPIVYLFQDTILFSVFVGINGDLYMANYMPDKSIVGGRVRPIEMAPDVIAKRPRYVVVHEKTHSGHALTPEVLESLPLEGYEEMMYEDGVKLLRWPGA